VSIAELTRVPNARPPLLMSTSGRDLLAIATSI
jgi:hypothetical protein